MSHVLEYVAVVSKILRPQGNSKKSGGGKLDAAFPLHGPIFMPPTPTQKYMWNPGAPVKPETWYLKPFTVLHPVFFPQLEKCALCHSKEIDWNGWTTSGPRTVHGIRSEEYVIGLQMHCGRLECKKSLTLTSHDFWKNVPHNEIPCKYLYVYLIISHSSHPRNIDEIPIFFSRCAVTQELYNLITELRLTGTAAGLEENIKRKYSMCLIMVKRDTY